MKLVLPIKKKVDEGRFEREEMERKMNEEQRAKREEMERKINEEQQAKREEMELMNERADAVFDGGDGGRGGRRKSGKAEAAEVAEKADEAELPPQPPPPTKAAKRVKQLGPTESKRGGKGVVPNVSLIKIFGDLDDCFLRASESAHEVSKMLEAHRLHYHSNFADNRGS